MQQSLAQTLGSLAASGTTIVLVAHALGAMTPLVTRAVVMEEGRIVYDGAPRSGDAALEHVHPHAPGTPSHWPRAAEPT
jgi:zinc transport system ATP-binding protein